MPDIDGRSDRPSPTSPEGAESLLELSESAETFGEPSGTRAEARRRGDIDEEGSQLDDAAARQTRLEQARQAMEEAAELGGAEGLGVQEEETARIADHLVFPGTGIRELRAQGRIDEVIEQVANADVPSPTDNPDRFPPAEWPPAEQASDARDRGVQASGGDASSEGRTLARSKQLLGEPWVLAGACLGAGLLIGLSVRVIKDRLGQQQTGNGNRATGKAKAPKSRVADVKEAAKDKVGEAKDTATAKAGEVLEAAKSKADEVKESAKGKSVTKESSRSRAARATPVNDDAAGKTDG